MSDDIQFQIECLAIELVDMLIEEYGWDMTKAFDELYGSRKLGGGSMGRLETALPFTMPARFGRLGSLRSMLEGFGGVEGVDMGAEGGGYFGSWLG